MRLLEMQRQMAQAILQPLTRNDRIAPGTSAALIKANNRLTAQERLEIYCRSYWFRVLDSFHDDFPGLRSVLGPDAFHALSRNYLADCPSQSFTLRNLGSRLEDWAQRNPQCLGKNPDLALDMIRLEWAHAEAFDNAAGPVLSPEDLAAVNSRFHLRLQPHVRLLSLQYPVDELRIEVNQREQEAPSQQRTRTRTRRITPQPVYLAVHRIDLVVYYRRLALEEHRLLTALDAGKSIGWAIRNTFKPSSLSSAEQSALLENSFAAWSQLGWLCPVVSSRPLRTLRKKDLDDHVV